MKQKWVVRVVLFRGIAQDDAIMSGPFLESLRYAGIVKVHRDDDAGMCFDLCYQNDHGINTMVWAEQNAKRMQTFGFNAVAAPAMP